MSGSIFGNIFRVTTWGESHGPALGAVIDGCPAGLLLDESDIQKMLDRRRPGTSKYTTARKEADSCEILSGVFEGKTTGTPISVMVRNTDQRSRDYSAIAHVYRPGHADYTYQEKYGIRDYRGGGRSSGRETIGRVIGGAVAEKILSELGINVIAYTSSIGDIKIDKFDPEYLPSDPLGMPDKDASDKAQEYLKKCMADLDSAGGVIECRISGAPAGLGEPVFDKLESELAKAVMSIGAVKGFEAGDGFSVSKSRGSTDNDPFYMDVDRVKKSSNHSGGMLGGMSDGSDIIIRAAVKPTPSISKQQETVSDHGTDETIEIKGRHDPVIVPRAVVVVESMAAITVADMLLRNMSSKLDSLREFYK